MGSHGRQSLLGGPRLSYMPSAKQSGTFKSQSSGAKTESLTRCTQPAPPRRRSPCRLDREMNGNMAKSDVDDVIQPHRTHRSGECRGLVPTNPRSPIPGNPKFYDENEELEIQPASRQEEGHCLFNRDLCGEGGGREELGSTSELDQKEVARTPTKSVRAYEDAICE